MKNLFKFFFVATVILATTACGAKKEEATEATADTTQMAEPAAEVAADTAASTNEAAPAGEAK